MDRRSSFAFLCISPFLIALVGALGALGVPRVVQYGFAGVLVAAILLAAWILGARAIFASAPERRRLAVAGGSLVTVLAALTFVSVMGPPHLASLAENQLRYPLLLLNAIAMATALIVLKEALYEAGERFHATLGFAAILIAGPLYVLFTAMQLLEYRALESVASGALPPEISLMDKLSLILLYFGAALTYLATAAFAAALGSLQWLGRTATRAYLIVSLFAAAFVGIRVAEALGSPQGPLWGFEHWTSAPGFILLIPAVPWLMPCLLGIVLLKRAGAQQANVDLG
jgi:hypothetical protein